MKFKRYFLAFALFWALAVCVISDILLISAFRQLPLDTGKHTPIAEMILLPTGFAAADWGLIMLFSRLLVRRMRRRMAAIEGTGEYAFFRNYVILLAAGAIANTALLLGRFRSVTAILEKEEIRRLSLLCSGQPAYREQRLEALSERLSFCSGAAVFMLIFLILLKAAGYLYIARSLVKTYHKHSMTAYC